MKEFTLLSSAMTASHHQRPVTQKEPVAVMLKARVITPCPTSGEKRKLRKDIDRYCQCKGRNGFDAEL
jgi:hypothetical protein